MSTGVRGARYPALARRSASVPLPDAHGPGYASYMGAAFSRRKFMAFGVAGIAGALVVPTLDSSDVAGAAGTAPVQTNPNLLWNGSFEVGSLNTPTKSTAVWTLPSWAIA